jgi:HlyD family secretion protein
MDIHRPELARKKRMRRTLYAVGVVAVIPLVTVGLSRLKPAAPTVEWAPLWPDTVKRGEMLRQVRGLGTLVPEEILWIPATTDGRVVRRFVLPGAVVKADTVILQLANPELEQSALDAEWQLKAAEAQYNSLKAQLDSQLLDQKAAAATVLSDYTQANLNAEKDVELAKRGLGAELNAKLSRARAEALATRNGIEKERLDVSAASAKAQLDAQKARVEQLRALSDLKKSQLDSLNVRAGEAGVLQELSVEVGQRVAAGTILAKVVQPTRLKAQIKVPETQAKDVVIGQKVAIDTRNGIIAGHVMRVDPAVQNGTVTVDVKLDEALPQGARPDLSVDGTIEIERLPDVMYVGRPVHGQPNSTISLFKVINNRKEAVRVRVKLGRSSVSTIEVLEGLQVGDQVILSDMSQWDSFDRLKLD